MKQLKIKCIKNYKIIITNYNRLTNPKKSNLLEY